MQKFQNQREIYHLLIVHPAPAGFFLKFMVEGNKNLGAFRPLSSQSVSPYDLPSLLNALLNDEGRGQTREWADIFSAPPIGVDGGILLRQNMVVDNKTMVNSYLIRRTIPTGRIYAVTHHGTNYREKKLHLTHGGSQWLSSRGVPYYDANIRFNNGEKEERRRILEHNLEEDSVIVQNWSRIRSELDTLPTEDRWRAYVAVLQNITNDLVGVDYALSIAKAYDPQLRQSALDYLDKIFNVAVLYYRKLLGHEIPVDEESKIMSFIAETPRMLAELKGITPQQIDDVRTRRETDSTFLTLAAAMSFMLEFKGVNPNVILPKLGSYDLGPALKALGYQGGIHYLIPSHKFTELTYERGESFFRQQGTHIEMGLDRYPRDNCDGAVIFDDSLTSGNTLDRVVSGCVANGIKIVAVRTMFANSQPENGSAEDRKRYELKYGQMTNSYFETPILRRNKHGGNQFLFQRVMSELMFRKRSKQNRDD